MHLKLLFPFILSIAGFAFSSWHLLSPRRALDFHIRYFRYGAFYPPQRNRYYFWQTIIIGVLGSIIFGLVAVGAGLELF